MNNRRIALFTMCMLLLAAKAYASSATWDLNPASDNWNRAINWTPDTVPDGPSDTATFDVSNTTNISFSADTEVADIVFNPGASAYTISATLQLIISGAGIINNSGIKQNFVSSSLTGTGEIQFHNSATAGDAAFLTDGGGGGSTLVSFYDSSSAANGTFTNLGGPFSSGGVQFFNSSTAANGVFINTPGTANGGGTNFFDSATADHATIICNSASATAGIPAHGYFLDDSSASNSTLIVNGATVPDGSFSAITFYENSTATDAIMTVNGGTAHRAFGGIFFFLGNSTAGHATITANGGTDGGRGGTIFFFASSHGGAARIALFGNGKMDLSLHNGPLTIGSLEGDGLVLLSGRANLTTGSNSLSTTFAGLIETAHGAIGGSLTKIGAGELSLTGANTYPDGTIVNEGGLVVNNVTGSGTGAGPVQVNAGTLSGQGIIAGAVTVGTGTGTVAVLEVGSRTSQGILTILSPLTFNSDATYRCGLDTDSASADQVEVNGVTINEGARFSLRSVGSSKLVIGTVFTVINNTSGTPIAGHFSNLADGATITVGNNNFQADYEGGDGNDLTLTVVP